MKTLLSLKNILIMALLAGAMLWVGIQKYKEGSEEKATVYQSLNEVDLEGPKWVKIEACELDILASYYDVLAAQNKALKELLIPLVANQAKSNNQFFLQTKELSFLELFQNFLSLQQKIRATEMNIEMSRQDPEYVKFIGISVKEQEENLEVLNKEMDVFISKNPPKTLSIEGVLNPSFALSEKEKIGLASSGNPQIIAHNKILKRGFYTWFLLIIGFGLALLTLLSIIGLLASKTK